MLRFTKFYGLQTDLWPVLCDRHILRHQQTHKDMHFYIIYINTIVIRNEPCSNTPSISSGLLYEDLCITTLKAVSHIEFRSHAAPMPFPCHAVSLRVYNVSFPFDLHSAAMSDSHLPCHDHAMLWPCRSSQSHGMVRAWHGRGMASVNQTRPHCVNQMGKTHSKHLAGRHGRGTAWARHAMRESALRGTVLVRWVIQGSA